MSEPEVLSITYDMRYFIEKAKQKCYRLKYKEDDIECAYGNLNQIFETIIKCVRKDQSHYSYYVLGEDVKIRCSSSEYSFRKFVEINSSAKFIKLMHCYDLYEEFCKVWPKYKENYYPAITLVDVLLRGACALLDKHSGIKEVNIRAGNYTNMNFHATRQKDGETYNFMLAVTELGSDPVDHEIKGVND